VIAYLSGYVDHKIEHSATCNCRQTLHQVAQLATAIAAYHRIKNGKDYVEPRTGLSHGANFLYMLHGKEPDELEGEIMDKCLVLHAEHSFNASTFTARVVASTLSTCYCSIAAAIGALFGSLHGGANEKVVAMVNEIGSKENVRSWVNKALDEKRKVMGMGHRVYKAPDPRALIIENYLKQLSEKNNDYKDYEILQEVRTVFRERMEEKGKPIYPNVDFFSGSVYRQLGIPANLFTPIFAVARVAGWLSHILEQRSDNRIFRPRALYKGFEGRKLVPIDQR
jgi:citrate synthase